MHKSVFESGRCPIGCNMHNTWASVTPFSFLKFGVSDALFCIFTSCNATEFKLVDVMEA